MDKIKMVAVNPKPRLQANFFWMAPIGSELCFLTNSHEINTVGENFGLIKTAMKKLKARNPERYGITMYCLMINP